MKKDILKSFLLKNLQHGDIEIILKNWRLYQKIMKLDDSAQAEIETVLNKVISKEPITDKEKALNPEMWARAEQYFNFNRG
jgi:hypothetical protein